MPLGYPGALLSIVGNLGGAVPGVVYSAYIEMNLSSMNDVNLRAALKARDLSGSGNKPDLVKWLAGGTATGPMDLG